MNGQNINSLESAPKENRIWMHKSIKCIKREFYTSLTLLIIFYVGIPLSSIRTFFLLLMVLGYGLVAIYLMIICWVGLFYGFYSIYKKEKSLSKSISAILGNVIFILASSFAFNGFFILKNIFNLSS